MFVALLPKVPNGPTVAGHVVTHVPVEESANDMKPGDDPGQVGTQNCVVGSA